MFNLCVIFGVIGGIRCVYMLLGYLLYEKLNQLGLDETDMFIKNNFLENLLAIGKSKHVNASQMAGLPHCGNKNTGEFLLN